MSPKDVPNNFDDETLSKALTGSINRTGAPDRMRSAEELGANERALSGLHINFTTLTPFLSRRSEGNQGVYGFNAKLLPQLFVYHSTKRDPLPRLDVAIGASDRGSEQQNAVR